MTSNEDSEKMVATCGMNCTYCQSHLRKKKPCIGCRFHDEGEPVHCKKCKIRDCASEKEVYFCSECADYPCILIKRLDKSYRTRYNESLINNLNVIDGKGMKYYLEFEQERLKCPECHGVLSFHHKECFECKKISDVYELE